MTSSEPVTSSLHLLLRCFVSGLIDAGYNSIEVSKRGRCARITHIIGKAELWVCSVRGLNPDNDLSKFDLYDPRSIGAAIRSLCRRVGDDMPSFYEIDRVLDEGPPSWM